ncbi:MAG: hypothetical protein WD738_12640 [Pirellulales bacterium]
MLRSLASLVVVGLLAAAALAADDVTVATILDGLQNPSGVAIRPETSADDYEIYVADAGAGRIARTRSGQSGNGDDVITGFASQPNRTDPFQSSGPRGLLFLDRVRLVVTGSAGKGRAFVRLYELSDEPTPLAAERYEQHVEPTAAGEQPELAVEAFYGLARTSANDSVADLLIVIAHGKERSAGTWKVPIRAGMLGELEVFRPSGPNETTVPSGIAVGRHGYVVMSEPGANRQSQAARLKFLNPIDGSVALELAADVPEIPGLAYSPRTGNLYVIASGNSDRDGVYRIEDIGRPGKPACAAVKVADVHRPTALVFGPDGALYVTALGEVDANETNTGVLLKLTGEL